MLKIYDLSVHINLNYCVWMTQSHVLLCFLNLVYCSVTFILSLQNVGAANEGHGEKEEHQETKGDGSITVLNHSMRWWENKEKVYKTLQTQTHTYRERRKRAHTHSGSTLAGALAASTLALVLVRAKLWGRTVLQNAAVICFRNATAVRSHERLQEMTARAGQGDSSVCSGAGTLQVMFSKALLNLMACKIR